MERMAQKPESIFFTVALSGELETTRGIMAEEQAKAKCRISSNKTDGHHGVIHAIATTTES